MKQRPWLLIDALDGSSGETVDLEEPEARHAAGALRCRPGDEIVLADGRGTVAVAVLRELATRRVSAELLTIDRKDPPGGQGVTLGLAIIDRSAMDWAVQKAVEIGVRRFVPVICERTQGRGRDLSSRLGHWRRTAMQALKQCRRPWSMELEEPQELAAFVDRFAIAVSWRIADGQPLPEISGGSKRALAVGPEGGFSASGDRSLRTNRLAPRTIGRQYSPRRNRGCGWCRNVDRKGRGAALRPPDIAEGDKR